jgi:predicted PurR-regulated permease PerM
MQDPIAIPIRRCKVTIQNNPETKEGDELPVPNDSAEIPSQATEAAPSPEPDEPFAQKAVLPSRIAVQVDARGMALATLAIVAFIFALQLAQKFFIPLLFGIFIAYTLNPLVAWLERIKIPRFAATSLIMLTVVCGAAVVANTVVSEVQSIMEELPISAHKLSRILSKSQDGQPSAIQKMQKAATEIEQATAPQTPEAARQAKRNVVADQPTIKVKELVLAGSMGVISFIGEATMVVFLVFFFLLSGDTFKRKLVKLTGPSLSQKKITVNILDDINSSIQRYMFMLLVTNLLLTFLMWIALRSFGLANAGAWALAAGLLHVIPYFGPLLITLSTGLTAYMQFESFSQAAMVGGISLGISTLIGMFVTTWMTGKIAKMNPAAVFIALLFWGWLWGVWGLLLGIPIVVIIKVISEHIEGMQPIAELLGE